MEILAAAGIIFLVILISIPISILNGFVLTKLWLWFVVPFGISEISLVHAIGLSMIVNYMTGQFDSRDKRKDEHVKSIIYSIIKPLFALTFGAIIKSFM